MANISENPSSPPKESTPTPSIRPSTTPIFKKRRFKMLARKVVAGGEHIKKINEQLKASQAEEPQKSRDSFKSATDGEESISSETEQETSGPKITSETISEVTKNQENRDSTHKRKSYKELEPSTLAKRTRSAMKSRKVKVVEEEESEEKEESDEEKDKMVKFGKKNILKGRLLRDLEEEGMMMLLEKTTTAGLEGHGPLDG
ncbi:nuclear localization sequence-binding protein-like [Nicotiana tomentosiformis]|uniref:nuclear localization sequence-binding protein-like n=1 Tax=Nicotiana tomentosiformis TaxID=4098 RepID=UPI00388CB428